MRQPSEHRVTVNGVEFALFEWGEKRGATVLLVHATGFHARCWDQVVAELGERHVIALDLRGHGRSGKAGPYTWDLFGADVVALVERLQLDGIVGVGHSMGGHLVTQAAAAHPQRFARLLLLDPVIMAPEAYGHSAATLLQGMDHPVARRRNRFTHAEEMIERMAQRASYATWDSRVLQDYCVHGLLPAEDGQGYELACPPAVEAAIYGGSMGCDIYPLIARLELPVTVLRAREKGPAAAQNDFSLSPTWPGLAARFRNGTDVPLPHLTHFIPMQDPALVARFIEEG